VLPQQIFTALFLPLLLFPQACTAFSPELLLPTSSNENIIDACIFFYLLLFQGTQLTSLKTCCCAGYLALHYRRWILKNQNMLCCPYSDLATIVLSLLLTEK
jgi:hypothetical protein